MVNKQGVHPFNICLFVVVFSFIQVFLFYFLANIQDALFLMNGKTRTCFSVVPVVLLHLILLLL